MYRGLLYAICVAHGYLLTMEVYSPRTISTRTRLTTEDLVVAVNFARKYFNSSSENMNFTLCNVCCVICEVVTTNIIFFLGGHSEVLNFAIACVHGFEMVVILFKNNCFSIKGMPYIRIDMG